METSRAAGLAHPRITPAGRKHLTSQVSSFEQTLESISLVLALGDS